MATCHAYSPHIETLHNSAVRISHSPHATHTISVQATREAAWHAMRSVRRVVYRDATGQERQVWALPIRHDGRTIGLAHCPMPARARVTFLALLLADAPRGPFRLTDACDGLEVVQ